MCATLTSVKCKSRFHFPHTQTPTQRHTWTLNVKHNWMTKTQNIPWNSISTHHFPRNVKTFDYFRWIKEKRIIWGAKIYYVNEQRQSSMQLRLLCLWLYRSNRSSKRVWGRGYGQGSSDQCPVISWSGKYQYNPNISTPSQFWPFIWSYNMLKSVFSLS